MFGFRKQRSLKGQDVKKKIHRRFGGEEKTSAIGMPRAARARIRKASLRAKDMNTDKKGRLSTVR